ncbi:MAG: sigma-54 dependent transcriptional regulator [Bacteroidales bacterium]|nr:sigma-54 dependent transcriptional regulator [Bacteroidales bacterium]
MTNQELQTLKNKYDIIGNDPALNRALEIAVAVAPTDITVLVTGESGVGKENIPKIIHQHSRRKSGKYFAVNCGAIPEGTIDSELFGHEKGSFTGANEMRRGYFEEADAGTLFLDEIGELPLSSQAKLLRVLQSGEFIRVGSSKVLKTDVRVVAATNVNLIHAVSKGKFREDLYYRLNAVSITMPSLRERPGDINLLFRKFVSDFSAKYGVGRVVLTEDASIMLRKYRWPGNIRQLKNVAETVAVLESARVPSQAEKCMVDAEALSRYIPKEDPNLLPVKSSSWQEENSGEREAIIRSIIQLKQDVDYLKDVVAKAGLSVQTPAAHVISAPVIQENTIAAVNHSNWGMPQENVEDPEEQELDAPANEDLSVESNCNDLIEKALHKHGGNRKAAAAELGISERTLYRKIKKLSE